MESYTLGKMLQKLWLWKRSRPKLFVVRPLWHSRKQ